MMLSVAEARRLAEQTFTSAGFSGDEAADIADHIIDCELRGIGYGGLARALSIYERVTQPQYRRGEISVVHETPLSALVDGANNPGYLVALRANEIAIEKALAHGMAMVGARDTWNTGMIAYYAEKAAHKGLVMMIASNASPYVAPFGGMEGRFGTNPIAFGFPSAQDPVVWDIGTASIMHGEVILAQRLGHELPEGSAYNSAGEPTTDPTEALAGALAAWGGHKGSGLAIVVQLLGAMCAVSPLPQGMQGYGCLFLALKPDLLMPLADYKASVAEYAAAIRSTRPVRGGPPVRMPFDRSLAERRQRLANDAIEVSDHVVEQLEAIVEKNSGAR